MIPLIPSKNSKKWIIFFMLYTAITWISLLITRLMLNIEVSGSIIFSMILLALGSAIFPCILGYLGKRIFFIVATLSVIVGILYMFYVVIRDNASGWGDLTSIIGYVFIVGIGTVIAIIAEVVMFIRNSIQNK